MPRASSKNESRRQKRLPPGVSNPVDIHVGQRLRLRRTLLGMSQEKLGDAVGLTFQQIQKYESGANRIAVSRLYEFAKILGVSVGWFVAGYDNEEEENNNELIYDNREMLAFIRLYNTITPEIRKKVFQLLQSVAKSDNY